MYDAIRVNDAASKLHRIREEKPLLRKEMGQFLQYTSGAHSELQRRITADQHRMRELGTVPAASSRPPLQVCELVYVSWSRAQLMNMLYLRL